MSGIVLLLATSVAGIFNVKSYGAVGDGVTDDTTAIRAALAAMWGSTARGAITYFPPGQYLVTSTIDISNPNGGSFNTNGIITGAGRDSSVITGTLNNGFILSQADNTNGPEEISHLRINNNSTWIGSGALMLNNSSAVIESCHFSGMTGVLLPFNIFDATINNCIGNNWSDVSTGYTGTFGIAGIATHVKNWRSTNPYQACIQFFSGNSASIEGCGIENCTAAIVLGLATGWASSCTLSGNILTVGGTLGTASAFPQFVRGAQIFMRGLTTTADWGLAPTAGLITIIDDHSSDGTLTGAGFAGTYRISTTGTISTPVPVLSRYETTCSGTTVSSLETEGCYYTIFLYNVGSTQITSSQATGTPLEAVDAFGATGYAPHSAIYLNKASATTISSFWPNNNPSGAMFYIAPSAVVDNVTFTSCIATKYTDNVGTGIISNGSGSAGTVLNITVSSGSHISIGNAVAGAGVTGGTLVTGNHSTDPTLTGIGGTGTYRVNTSQLVASTALTIPTGADWVMPTATASKAGLRFINCNSIMPAGVASALGTLGMTFTCLPGQAGADANLSVVQGMEYDIIDSNTATWGATVAGGGSNKVRVRYNGTNWTVMGA